MQDAKFKDLTRLTLVATACLWYEQRSFKMIHTLTNIRMPSIGAPLGIERAELSPLFKLKDLTPRKLWTC